MSLLFIGDMHVVENEIPDASALIEGLLDLPYSNLVFLGDQMHSHAVLSLRVVDFWQRAVERLKKSGKNVWMLVGNHDMATSGHGPHAMQTLDVQVVDRPTKISENMVAIPYCHGREAFLKAQQEAKDLMSFGGELVLVCHQTFAGAQYENGFYAPDGIPVEDLLFPYIISGHIHMFSEILPQSGVCKSIKYVGSPRWRTKSDANQDKFLLGCPQGILGAAEFIDTSKWCSPIEVLEDRADIDGDPLLRRRWQNSRLTVVVRGEPAAVIARAADLEARNVAVLPRPDAQAAPRVSESAPVMRSYQDFLRSYRAPGGTAGDRLVETALGYQQWQQ